LATYAECVTIFDAGQRPGEDSDFLTRYLRPLNRGEVALDDPDKVVAPDARRAATRERGPALMSS
jgi:hypothetical protein